MTPPWLLVLVLVGAPMLAGCLGGTDEFRVGIRNQSTMPHAYWLNVSLKTPSGWSLVGSSEGRMNHDPETKYVISHDKDGLYRVDLALGNGTNLSNEVGFSRRDGTFVDYTLWPGVVHFYVSSR